MSGRDCGECGLCCKVFEFAELSKPAGVWCQHHRSRKGCSIHESRPQTCRLFFCTWILRPEEFGEDWRPDIAGFLMWSQNTEAGPALVVDVDPSRPHDWRREPYHSILRAIAVRRPDHHVQVVVRTRESIQMLFPEGLITLGKQRNLPIASGYRNSAGQLVPFAHYVEPAASLQ